MSFSKGLLGSTVIYTIPNIINTGISFLLLPILTRVLTPADYGAVAMFVAVSYGLSALTGLSVHGAVATRYFTDDRATFPQFVAVCFMILAASSTAAVVVLIVGAPVLADLTGLTTQWLVLAAVASTTQVLINIRLIIWQNRLEPVHHGLFQIAQAALNAGLSLYLVLVLRWGAEGRLWAIIFSLFIFGVIALLTLQGKGLVHWRWNREYARSALSWGVPLIPHVLAGFAISMADRFIITNRLGIGLTGIYFVAVQMSMPLVMLGDSFNRAFRPWIYSRLAEKKNADAVLASYISIVVFALLGLLYGIILFFAFPIIVGAQYQSALDVAPILILSSVFQASYYAVSNFILFKGRTGPLSLLSISLGLVYVVVGWYVVKDFGLIGLAIAFTLQHATYFFAVWWLSAKLNPMPWFKFGSLAASAKELRKFIPKAVRLAE